MGGFAGLAQVANLAPGPLLLGVLVLLAIVGFAGWLVIRRGARRRGEPAPRLAEVAAAWEEACCPACLALGALGQARREAVPAT